jgi:hypothetical protein
LQLAHSRDDAPPELARLVGEALEDTRAAIDELRELAHGIHPAVLTHRGLAAAVEALADRAPVPVHVDIPDDRFPAFAESAAYFVAAEALTNVAKYAHASTARVTATRTADALVIAVEDDGVGGAKPSPGSGLSGLQDRVAALDGTLLVDSPPREGTRIRANIPLPLSPSSDPVDSASVARALTAAPAGRRRSPGPHVLRQPGHPPAIRARAGGSRGACRRPLTPKARGETSPLSTRTAVPPALSTSMRQGAAAPAGLIDWPAAAFARSSDRR